MLVALAPQFSEDDEIYAYAIGVLVGTVIQLAIPAWDLRHTPFEIGQGASMVEGASSGCTPDVKQVLILMLPVTISLGLINFNLLINSFFGTLVSDEAPAAIDKAFRIYMLPQGIFSVAIATVVFPTLARFAAREELRRPAPTMANGMRQILLMLVPAAAAILVLSEPMTRLVYQRGEFGPAQTDVVAEALFWFAFSLPLNGLFLIFTRTFFSLQRPWVPSAVSGVNLAITAIAALALYSPFGVAGIVASTAIATGASVVAYAYVMRGVLHGIEFRRLLWSATRITAAAALLAAVSYLVWLGLDDALGTSVPAQIVSLGAALAAGSAVYFGAVSRSGCRRPIRCCDCFVAPAPGLGSAAWPRTWTGRWSGSATATRPSTAATSTSRRSSSTPTSIGTEWRTSRRACRAGTPCGRTWSRPSSRNRGSRSPRWRRSATTSWSTPSSSATGPAAASRSTRGLPPVAHGGRHGSRVPVLRHPRRGGRSRPGETRRIRRLTVTDRADRRSPWPLGRAKVSGDVRSDWGRHR